MSFVIDAVAISCVQLVRFCAKSVIYRENDSRVITNIIRQRQLQLYGHVARYSVDDPAYCFFIFFKKDI